VVAVLAGARPRHRGAQAQLGEEGRGEGSEVADLAADDEDPAGVDVVGRRARIDAEAPEPDLPARVERPDRPDGDLGAGAQEAQRGVGVGLVGGRRDRLEAAVIAEDEAHLDHRRQREGGGQLEGQRRAVAARSLDVARVVLEGGVGRRPVEPPDAEPGRQAERHPAGCLGAHRSGGLGPRARRGQKGADEDDRERGGVAARHGRPEQTTCLPDRARSVCRVAPTTRALVEPLGEAQRPDRRAHGRGHAQVRRRRGLPPTARRGRG
jgi:hypothetical protein